MANRRHCATQINVHRERTVTPSIVRQPYPPRYCYYAIVEGRVWSDSTGFRVCAECDVIDRNY